jgi:hypothetical protein
MRLTAEQVRLCGVEQKTCQIALGELVNAKFLYVNGHYAFDRWTVHATPPRQADFSADAIKGVVGEPHNRFTETRSSDHCGCTASARRYHTPLWNRSFQSPQRSRLMGFHRRPLAFFAVMILIRSTPAFAGRQSRHSIRVEKTEVSTDASAVFNCELRFFDITLNAGRVPCYGPSAIRAAYGLTGLIDGGFTGRGRTIVILDAFGSPTALADLQAFDTAFGLPDPPSFTVVTMPGTPAFDPTDGNQVGWAEETSLDVQWSHAVARREDRAGRGQSNSDEDRSRD